MRHEVDFGILVETPGDEPLVYLANQYTIGVYRSEGWYSTGWAVAEANARALLSLIDAPRPTQESEYLPVEAVRRSEEDYLRPYAEQAVEDLVGERVAIGEVYVGDWGGLGDPPKVLPVRIKRRDHAYRFGVAVLASEKDLVDNLIALAEVYPLVDDMIYSEVEWERIEAYLFGGDLEPQVTDPYVSGEPFNRLIDDLADYGYLPEGSFIPRLPEEAERRVFRMALRKGIGEVVDCESEPTPSIRDPDGDLPDFWKAVRFGLERYSWRKALRLGGVKRFIQRRVRLSRQLRFPWAEASAAV